MYVRTERKMDPIGDRLDEMVTVEVLKEGTGLTLGITPTMMKFLSDKTPYIGMSPLTSLCRHFMLE